MIRRLTALPHCTYAVRCLHKSAPRAFFDLVRKKQDEVEKSLMVAPDKEYFTPDQIKERNKLTFKIALNKYMQRESVYRRGHVEFITAALSRMKEYGVERDLDVYKMLLNIFPKERMKSVTAWQVEFQHYPKQQQCAIDILEQMEYNGVCPDDAVGYILRSVFGDKVHAFRKYRRIMYWLPKFKNSNPYPVPFKLPDDEIELAKMALRRMSVDLENQISVFHTEKIEGVGEDTFVASAQSPEQRRIINKHPRERPLFVEGAFRVWLRKKALLHFVLKDEFTEYRSPQQIKESIDRDEDLFEWRSCFEFEQPTDLIKRPSIHAQQDGTLLGMCISGTASLDSVKAWVKFLQLTNPRLADIPIIFRISTPEEILSLMAKEHGQVATVS